MYARGIIPARAGFTNVNVPNVAKMEDHPRSRGVYPFCSIWLARVAGSSPLARGLRVLDEDRVRLARIIPARAGFTCVRRSIHY